MSDLAQYIPTHSFFEGIDAGEVKRVADCAAAIDVPGGKRLFYQGDPAMNMYLVRDGKFVLRAQGRDRSAATVDAVGPGEVVGWSWMVPPYRWVFDAIAVQDSRVVAIDASCLRQHCEDNSAFGYAVMQRVAQVMHHRLRGARARLLDAQGSGHGGHW